MKRSVGQWKELFDGNTLGLFQTKKNKKGECDFVLSTHSKYEYFTEQEFFELVDACKQAMDMIFKPKGDCYQ